jgi:hypothetical protein
VFPPQSLIKKILHDLGVALFFQRFLCCYSSLRFLSSLGQAYRLMSFNFVTVTRNVVTDLLVHCSSLIYHAVTFLDEIAVDLQLAGVDFYVLASLIMLHSPVDFKVHFIDHVLNTLPIHPAFWLFFIFSLFLHSERNPFPCFLHERQFTVLDFLSLPFLLLSAQVHSFF